jgi:hypothetical protein
VAFVASDVLQEKLRSNGWPDALLAVAESWNVAAGTRVAVSDENVTDATVGAGGPATSPPRQEPISQPRVSNPIERYRLSMREGLDDSSEMPYGKSLPTPN